MAVDLGGIEGGAGTATSIAGQTEDRPFEGRWTRPWLMHPRLPVGYGGRNWGHRQQTADNEQ
ncbi:MAG: hypothetical protein KatS3mg056_1999 [Chloroflexus sp.]|nr:MAG: hypothetical protein KatS3mg056_1999 [Chloroflexus sp.]